MYRKLLGSQGWVIRQGLGESASLPHRRFCLKTPGLADSHIPGGRFLWKVMWTSLEAEEHLRPFVYSPAYLAYDILQDVLCHLDENIHNMMCLEVLVVNMPK